MKSVVGVFRSRTDAERAYNELCSSGIDQSTVLTPDNARRKLEKVPTIEGERPGMGTAVGGVVGTAFGAAGGASIGAAFASAFFPGVGPVLIVGMAAAGLAGGMAAGAALENAQTTGLPADELFVYEDALRKGRSVVVTMADDEKRRERAQDILLRAGAESLDAAREDWWLGLRSAEEATYEAEGRDFGGDETTYRKGFEAALQVRGRSWADAQEFLRENYADSYKSEAFRNGFERGVAHHHHQVERYREAA